MEAYRVYTQEPYEPPCNISYFFSYADAAIEKRMIAVNAFNNCIVNGAIEEDADEYSSFDSCFTFIDTIVIQ